MLGLKFIPLRNPAGESTSHVGLFVKIALTSSRRCPQDLESSVRRFSPPALPETCRYSESFEYMAPTDHMTEVSDQEITVHLKSNSSANGGHILSGAAPKLFRQGAINEHIVEVHAENNAHNIDDNPEDVTSV